MGKRKAKEKERSSWGSKRPRNKSKTSWELRWHVAGKPGHETFHGTRSEAERRLAELRIKYEGASADVTLDDYWNNCYLINGIKGLAPCTVNGYKSKYTNHIKPVFGDLMLSEITPKIIQPWLLSMTHENAKHCKTVLSSILSRAVVDELVTVNMAAIRYQLPKTNGKSANKDVYSAEELEEVFRACKGEVFEAALILAGGGGALREEAMSPKLEEIRFIDEFAIVPIVRGIQRIDGQVKVLDYTKTDKREADLIIPPPYSKRLRELKAEGLERGEVWLTDDGFGNPNCPVRISKAYERWFIRNPYRYVPFCNLRNTYSTIMHRLKLPDSLISKLMRHSNLTTDYKHYNRLDTEDKVELLREAMGNVAHNCP